MTDREEELKRREEVIDRREQALKRRRVRVVSPLNDQERKREFFSSK